MEQTPNEKQQSAIETPISGLIIFYGTISFMIILEIIMLLTLRR